MSSLFLNFLKQNKKLLLLFVPPPISVSGPGNDKNSI